MKSGRLSCLSLGCVDFLKLNMSPFNTFEFSCVCCFFLMNLLMVPGPSSFSKDSLGSYSGVLGMSNNKLKRNMAHYFLGKAITI